MQYLLILLAAALSTTFMAKAKQFAGLSSSFCHLQSDGQVFCAGTNYYGQLGVGSTANSFATPLQMLYVIEASDVSMAETHTCIVDQGGRARCVGYNYVIFYTLGDGTTKSSNVLVNVLGLQSGVAQVFSSATANCALMETGAAWCWGYNYYGALGSGSTSTPAQPVPVVGFETGGAALIAMGDYHTCFLSTQGKILCTGENDEGQLGNGTKTDSSKPIPVLGLGTSTVFVSVSCGNAHTCAVSNNGAVLCWGENDEGQLGLGSNTADFILPEQVIASGASSVWTSEDNTFVIMSDRTAMAFGKNVYGELGNGNQLKVTTPIPFASGVGNIKELRGGDETTCILFLNDTIQCLGENSLGQFGAGDDAPESSFVLVSRLTGAALPPTVPITLKPTSMAPTKSPTPPTKVPTSKNPTLLPTVAPTNLPTVEPTQSPTGVPTTMAPTLLPTPSPTNTPTLPTAQPTRRPTRQSDPSVGDPSVGGNAVLTGPMAALSVLSVLLLA
ncbi:hypothetical protein BASA81_012897 [Batrachochytrium salamandrivorans]|nr:hypothetical protein BASA81_012897 [Batrachochytrium salamandrivorans]